jgi:hypothetical protein
MPIEVTVKDNGHFVNMANLLVGEACRRLADGEYFIKTNQSNLGWVEGGTNEKTYVCVALRDFNVHNIKASTRVQVVPRTEIILHWTPDN